MDTWSSIYQGYVRTKRGLYLKYGFAPDNVMPFIIV